MEWLIPLALGIITGILVMIFIELVVIRNKLNNK